MNSRPYGGSVTMACTLSLGIDFMASTQSPVLTYSND
jgi:hypothetical protein